MYKIFVGLFLFIVLQGHSNEMPIDFDLLGQQIHEQYLQDFKVFTDNVTRLQRTVQQKKETALKTILFETRSSYKKIEHFIDHYDSLKVKYYINGAPLPKAEEHANLPNLIEAQGLQMIDEMAYEEAVDWKALENQLSLLNKHTSEIQQSHTKKKYQERYYFEAARRQIIRIFTLSLTNFDTPGSGNGINESIVSMKSLQRYFNMHEAVVESKSKWLYQNINFLYTSAITYLQECGDFESFDHLNFYKSYLQPIYQKLYACHKLLNIKTIDELSNLPQSVQYNSNFVFKEDFFNAGFYADTYPQNISEERAGLGKILFFDPVLSANNTGSCASCHHPEKAFTDGLKKSKGLVSNSTINRNSPTIINAVFADRYFWDLEEGSLEKQIEKVVVNHKEMQISFPEIVTKLNKSKAYDNYFQKNYPGLGIDKWSISNALINYMLTLNSFNSPFDKYARGEAVELDESVIDGFNLFMGKAGCATCHFPPTFSGLVPPLYYETESEVLGIPVNNDTLNPVLDDDLGRYMNGRRKEHFENYQRSFKTPTVRNAALTAPYMHNGVFESLEEVMEFYNNGGGLGLGLDVPHQTLPGDSLHLNDKEQKDIIAFMQSLTDTAKLTSKPSRLPVFEDEELNKRVIGGTY